jgi:hypothetical protein
MFLREGGTCVGLLNFDAASPIKGEQATVLLTRLALGGLLEVEDGCFGHKRGDDW